MLETHTQTENVYTVAHFSTLYNRYQTLVRQQINALGLYRDRDDYFQEGMIAIVQALTHLDPEHPNKLAYLTQHVRRRLIDKLRQQTRQTRNIHYTSEASELDTCVTATYECELLDHFDPEDHTLIYYIINGYTNKEIAAKMGVHPRTISRRLQKYQHRFAY